MKGPASWPPCEKPRSMRGPGAKHEGELATWGEAQPMPRICKENRHTEPFPNLTTEPGAK